MIFSLRNAAADRKKLAVTRSSFAGKSLVSSSALISFSIKKSSLEYPNERVYGNPVWKTTDILS